MATYWDISIYKGYEDPDSGRQEVAAGEDAMEVAAGVGGLRGRTAPASADHEKVLLDKTKAPQRARAGKSTGRRFSGAPPLNYAEERWDAFLVKIVKKRKTSVRFIVL